MLIVPFEGLRRELAVSNSRFIATLSPVDSMEGARGFIASIKKEFPDATHNVPACIVGGGNTITEFCSDDGEPSGTSGRPLLAVLKGSGLGNVAIVVTRYFGGTLLGTGGLARAYAEAGRRVLVDVRRAEVMPSRRVSYDVSYHLFERARSAAQESGAVILREDFAESVRVELELPADGREAFAARLAELGAGSIALVDLAEGTMKRLLD